MTGRSRSYREGLLRRLKDNTEAANYLQAALEDSYAAFRVALKNVLDARKVAAVARESNVSREHIYQMLTKAGNPTLNSLERILSVLGLRLAIQQTQPPCQVPITEKVWICAWYSGKGLEHERNKYRPTPTWSSITLSRPSTAMCGEPATDRKSGGRSAAHSQPTSVRPAEDCFEIAC